MFPSDSASATGIAFPSAVAGGWRWIVGLLDKLKDSFTDVFAGPQKAASTERKASFTNARKASEELTATNQVATTGSFEDALLADVMPTLSLVGGQVGASLSKQAPALSSAFKSFVPQNAARGYAGSFAPQLATELNRARASAISGQPLPSSPDYSRAASTLFRGLEAAYLPKEYYRG
jgi:hypothetical protein